MLNRQNSPWSHSGAAAHSRFSPLAAGSARTSVHKCYLINAAVGRQSSTSKLWFGQPAAWAGFWSAGGAGVAPGELGELPGDAPWTIRSDMG